MITKKYELAFTLADNAVKVAPALNELAAEYERTPNLPQIDALNKRFDRNTFGLMTSMRGIANIGASLEAIGIISDDSARIMDAIYRAVMVNYAIWLLYEGITAMINILTVRTIIDAAFETYETIRKYGIYAGAALIATAAATAGITYAAFEFASGSWKLPSFDINNPSARRQALSNARAQVVA